MERLCTRRRNIWLKFAKKSLFSNRFESWFVFADQCEHLRNVKRSSNNTLICTFSRAKKLYKSPIPYFTRILN